MIAEFVLAAVILFIAWLFLKVAMALGAVQETRIDATIDAYSASRVCGPDLLNFLRSTDQATGLTYAELLALAEKSSRYKGLFESSTYDFFDNYKRGDTGRQLWRLDASIGLNPVTGIGPLDIAEPLDTCSQHIPSLEPDKYIKVKLGVEY